MYVYDVYLIIYYMYMYGGLKNKQAKPKMKF